MTTYSDDKNPYPLSVGWMEYPCNSYRGIRLQINQDRHEAWKEGYLAAEKDLGFTRYQVRVLLKLIGLSKAALDEEEKTIVKEIEKKVLGEK